MIEAGSLRGGWSLPATITLDLGGLTPGRCYEFEWWANNSSNVDKWFVTSRSAGKSVSVSANTLGSQAGQGFGSNGGAGQFAIGRYTADSTSHSIAFNGEDFYVPIINGFQLRAVPEPTTSILATRGNSLRRLLDVAAEAGLKRTSQRATFRVRLS